MTSIWKERRVTCSARGLLVLLLLSPGSPGPPTGFASSRLLPSTSGVVVDTSGDGGTGREGEQEGWDLGAVWRVLEAVERGVSFMGREYLSVNLDAVIGTRILEGQLEGVLKVLEASGSPPGAQGPPRALLAPLRSLLRRSINVSDSAELSVQRTQRTYYQRIGLLISRDFWRQDYPSRDLDPTQITVPLLDDEAMTEAQSDECLTELMGTGKHAGEKCDVSRDCWTLMTSPGYSHYSLTHQAFYLMIGQTVGCFERFVIEPFTAGFCGHVLAEAEGIARQGYPPDRQDLFMEQAALCGLLGYRQFFRRAWLDKILDWQSDGRGCWADLTLPTSNKGSDVTLVRSANGRRGLRFKREERVLSDGCASHRTAVALAALGGYIRYTIESVQQQQ